MPVNSGSSPGAPLGGHITQAGPLLEDPVGVAAPAVDALAVDALPPRVVPPPVAVPPATPDPPETVLLLPPILPPVVPVVDAPPAAPVVELVGADPGAPVATVEVVVPVAGVEVAVPGVGVASVVAEFCTLGNATAPPPAGKPLRRAALPTAPVVGVAEGAVVCASAGETRLIDRKKANAGMRIMAGCMMPYRPARRETVDQTA